MSYMISASDMGKICFNEKNVVKSVIQNIAVILSTPKGSVPMNREFGVDQSFVDKPQPIAEVAMIAPVTEAIHRWESRATVLNVYPAADPTQPGRLIPMVEVDINAES